MCDDVLQARIVFPPWTTPVVKQAILTKVKEIEQIDAERLGETDQYNLYRSMEGDDE